jgi:hypothetical protein
VADDAALEEAMRAKAIHDARRAWELAEQERLRTELERGQVVAFTEVQAWAEDRDTMILAALPELVNGIIACLPAGDRLQAGDAARGAVERFRTTVAQGFRRGRKS